MTNPRANRPKLLTVIGTRPQYIKYAAVATHLAAHFDETVIDTGQHYDAALSRQFIQEFFPTAAFRTLSVAARDARTRLPAMLARIDALIDELRPDLVLCFGDTDSTLAAGLAAARCGIPLCHVEAGERSRTADGTRIPARAAPEESNRIIVDHLAALRCCTTDEAARTCDAEGCLGRSVVTGDITYDIFLAQRRHMPDVLSLLRAQGCERSPFFLASVHRAVNTDDRSRLATILDTLDDLPHPVLLPLHPRTERRMREFDLPRPTRALRLIAPLSHGETLALLARAARVLTDSGGLTREAYFSAVPSVCLDDATAWHLLVRNGWCALTGCDREAIHRAVAAPAPDRHDPTLFGDGRAALRVVNALREFSARPTPGLPPPATVPRDASA